MKNLLRHDWSDTDVKWSEDELQAAVVRWLKRHDFMVAADQNAGKRSKRDGGVRKATGMAAGEPDLRIYLPDGKVIFIEMKTKSGSVSKVQRERIGMLMDRGFQVHVVRGACPDDCVAVVQNIMEPHT